MYVYAIAMYFFRTDFSAFTFQRFDHTGASFESREYWQCSVAHMFWNSSSLKKKKRSWGRDHLALNLLVALGWRTFQSHSCHRQSTVNHAQPGERHVYILRPSLIPMRVLADGGVWAVDCDGMIVVWPLGMYWRTLQSHYFHRQSTVNHAQPGERHMWLECTSAESNQ